MVNARQSDVLIPVLDPARSRRTALWQGVTMLAALGAGFMSRDVQARKRKKKKRRCPDLCPQRVACICSGEACVYLPMPAQPTNPHDACIGYCAGRSAYVASSYSENGYAAVCTQWEHTSEALCPLV